LKEICQ
jgi:hypothetical protein